MIRPSKENLTENCAGSQILEECIIEPYFNWLEKTCANENIKYKNVVMLENLNWLAENLCNPNRPEIYSKLKELSQKAKEEYAIEMYT